LRNYDGVLPYGGVEYNVGYINFAIFFATAVYGRHQGVTDVSPPKNYPLVKFMLAAAAATTGISYLSSSRNPPPP